MAGVEYLREIYPFDDDVIAEVEKTVYGQQGIGWTEYVAAADLPDLQIFSPKDGKPIEVLDIIPRNYEGVRVLHMPMGCALDAELQAHVLTVAESDQTKRAISASNPSQLGRGLGKLTWQDIVKVWKGDFRPTVAPMLEYLNSQGVEEAEHSGWSYGAEKTAASALHADKYDHRVMGAVMVEPIAIQEGRGGIATARAFASTSEHLDEYIAPAKAVSDTFSDTQNYKASSTAFVMGIATRATNLAIGNALGKDGFEKTITTALAINPELKTAYAWGTESELALHGLVSALTSRLASKFGQERVQTMVLEGHRHAMNVDPFLNTALILQASKALR